MALPLWIQDKQQHPFRPIAGVAGAATSDAPASVMELPALPSSTYEHPKRTTSFLSLLGSIVVSSLLGYIPSPSRRGTIETAFGWFLRRERERERTTISPVSPFSVGVFMGSIASVFYRVYCNFLI